MKFAEAYRYAMDHSRGFRKHDEQVRYRAAAGGEQCGCMVFSVAPAPGETFYYGYDGSDLMKGKHSPKRSAYLLKIGAVYEIN